MKRASPTSTKKRVKVVTEEERKEKSVVKKAHPTSSASGGLRGARKKVMVKEKTVKEKTVKEKKVSGAVRSRTKEPMATPVTPPVQEGQAIPPSYSFPPAPVAPAGKQAPPAGVSLSQIARPTVPQPSALVTPTSAPRRGQSAVPPGVSLAHLPKRAAPPSPAPVRQRLTVVSSSGTHLHPKRLIIGLAVVTILTGVFVSVRSLPCMFNAGRFGWMTWTHVAPNLACTLDLEAAKLQEFPQRILSFRNLQRLSVSGNRLKNIPEGIGGLTHLAVLYADDNQLQSLPTSMGNLTNLRRLSLRGNRFSSLPSELGSLPSLSGLNFGGNGLSPDAQIEVSLGLPNTQVDFGSSSSPATGGGGGSASASASGGGTSSASASASSSSSSSSDNFLTVPLSSESSQSSASEGSVASQGGGSDSSGGSGSSGGAEGSGSSASQSSSTVAGTGNSSSAAGDGPPPVGCLRNAEMNGYAFCLPDAWTMTVTTPDAAAVIKAGSTIVAKVTCPLKQTQYEGWNVTADHRTYAKSGSTHGSDLLIGIPADGSDGHLLIILMHRHSLNSWFGSNYTDVHQSCEIESEKPATDQEIFRTIYVSVY